MERIVSLPPGRYTKAGIALFVSLAIAGCGASLKSARHGGTVTVVGAHSTLAALQDTEAKLVCGVPGAPPAPTCVTPEAHRAIAAKLAVAFRLDVELAGVVRAMPTAGPTPPEVFNLVAKIQTLITDILSLIPSSAEKDKLSMIIS